MSNKKLNNNAIEILVVEDSPTQAENLRHLLEEDGFRTVVAENGKKALAEAHKHKPSIIISDIVMPEMDGYAFCKAIKSDKRLEDIPVILLTSLSHPKDVVKGLQCGADNFIRKPFDAKYLLTRVEYILANRELRKSDKMQMGIELVLGGQKHFIEAERQQILDLLISTFEEAVHMNSELKAKERELVHSYGSLNGLYRIAEGLNRATNERDVCERALERAMELPGVRAGWISLRDGDSGFRTAAVKDLPPALQDPGSLEGTCLCRRKLLSGELDQVTNILECERLQKASGDTKGLRYHATIPLWACERILGIMNLVGEGKGLFSDEDLRTLYSVGNQVGIALERARLQEHLEQMVQERTAALTEEIAERKRAEEALRNAETRYRALFEQSPNGVLLIETETGKTIEANETTHKQLGYTREEFAALRISDYEALEKPEETARHMQKVIREGSDDFETLHRTKSGEMRNVHVWAKRLQLGERILFYVIFEDITERKHAEEALRASEERYRELFENNPQPMWVSDRKTLSFLAVNEAAVNHYGYSREKFLTMTIQDIYPPELRVALSETVANNTEVLQKVGVWQHRKKDDSLIDVEITTHELDFNGRPSRLVMANDITERKRLEEERKILERQLMQAQKMESIGTLAGGIAHDFNNILGIILGHISLLERNASDPNILSTSADTISKAVQRGANLVRQILTFARKTDVSLEPVSVNATITELSRMLQETFPKTIEIALSLDNTIPIIPMDQTQLHQALLNLCVNARDAMTDPSPTNLRRGTLSIRTELLPGSQLRHKFDSSAESQYVCISVSDTGMGMDETTKQKIFEPFFTTKEQGKGTGLGLAVVYGVVKSLQGFVDVESEAGRGTTFKLYLPIRASVAGPTKTRNSELAETKGGTETILVVEDEEGLMSMMKSVLEAKGYHVITARDGIEAIHQYTEHKVSIALVISDMGLPKLDGLAVFSTIKDINPGVKLIMASGYVEPSTKSELFKTGVKEIVQKPYQPNEVLRKIRTILDSE